MDIRAYIETDRATIDQWCDQWRMERFPTGYLSKTGYLVPGKAVGFLYQTDSKVCYIDGLLANPSISKTQRSEAIDQVVKAIIKAAKHLGFKYLLGTTKVKEVETRAIMKHQFKSDTVTLVIRSL